MKDFKQFCKELFLGVFTVAALIFIVNTTGWFDYHELSSKAEQVWTQHIKEKPKRKANIAFFGNSQCFYLNPTILDAITNETSEVLGYPSAEIQPLYWLISNYLEVSNPKLIVLETHSFILIPTHRRSAVDSIRYARWDSLVPHFNTSPYGLTYINYNKPKPWFSNTIFNNDKFVLPYVITGPAIKNRIIIEKHPKFLINAIFKSSSKHNSSFGFRKSELIPISNNNAVINYSNRLPGRDTKIDVKALNYVEKIIDLCHAKNIKILVYESPMYYKHFKPQKKRYNQIEAFCKRLNVKFLNLNKDSLITKNPTYFENTLEDNQHLTAIGADVVSKILAKEIKNYNTNR